MVNQKGGLFQWLLMKEMMNKQKGGLYIHRKKHKQKGGVFSIHKLLDKKKWQKGGRAYTPIEEIRRRHFRKLMLKAMKQKKKQKGGLVNYRWVKRHTNFD